MRETKLKKIIMLPRNISKIVCIFYITKPEKNPKLQNKQKYI